MVLYKPTCIYVTILFNVNHRHKYNDILGFMFHIDTNLKAVNNSILKFVVYQDLLV